MYGDIYSTRYMGKTTDIFERLKFQLPQNILLYANPVYCGVGKINLLLVLNGLTLSTLMILWRPLTNEYINVVNLFQ